MLDLVAIAQSAPGPIAVNGAIVVGYKLAGIKGIIISVLGTILPPFLIISVVSMFYQAFKEQLLIALMLEGMQAGVGAVIASVTYEMALGIMKEKNVLSYVIMVMAFVGQYCLNINVVYIILTCIGIGLIQHFYMKRGEG